MNIKLKSDIINIVNLMKDKQYKSVFNYCSRLERTYIAYLLTNLPIEYRNKFINILYPEDAYSGYKFKINNLSMN